MNKTPQKKTADLQLNVYCFWLLPLRFISSNQVTAAVSWNYELNVRWGGALNRRRSVVTGSRRV